MPRVKAAGQSQDSRKLDDGREVRSQSRGKGWGTLEGRARFGPCSFCFRLLTSKRAYLCQGTWKDAPQAAISTPRRYRLSPADDAGFCLLEFPSSAYHQMTAFNKSEKNGLRRLKTPVGMQTFHKGTARTPFFYLSRQSPAPLLLSSCPLFPLTKSRSSSLLHPSP